MIDSLTLRALIERMTTTLRDVAPSTANDNIEIVDNVSGAGYRDLAKFKKRDKAPREIAGVHYAVMHNTGTPFGVRDYQISPWRRRAPSGLQEPVEAWATRMAYYARFWETPYHYVILRNYDVLFNAPIQWRTWHGDSGNSGIGIAFEGLFPAMEKSRKPNHTVLDPARACSCLVAAINDARRRGAPIESLQAHRNFATPRRRAGDPGEWIWRNAVIPAADATQCVIDYLIMRGAGLPIPREWDDKAMFNFQGKRTA